jgi:NADPH-dependent 2,4-dienoyl-CoA reductase/sulfur reductase-like enzyme
MASRKPLVLVGGEIQQLQAGDTLTGPFGEVDTITLTNGDSGAHALGDVVYISANDTGKKAKADAVGTKDAIAFAMGAVTAGAAGSYQTDGILSGLTGLVADRSVCRSARHCNLNH